MPGVPPNAIETLKSKFKSLLRRKSKKEDKPAKTVEPAATPVAADTTEPTKTADAPAPVPATTEPTPVVKTEEPTVPKETLNEEPATAKEEAVKPVNSTVAESKPGPASVTTEAPVEKVEKPAETEAPAPVLAS